MSVNSLGQQLYMKSTIRSLNDRLQTLEQQISSQKKAQTFGDHGGIEARRVISLREDVRRRESYSATIDVLDARTSQTELIMKRLQNSVTGVRDTALRFGAEGMDPNLVQQQALSSFEEMYHLMNTNISGYFIFNGVESTVSPMRPLDEIKTAVTDMIKTRLDDQLATAQAATVPPALPPLRAPEPERVLEWTKEFFDNPLNYMNIDAMGAVPVGERTDPADPSSYDPALFDPANPSVFERPSADPTTWRLKTPQFHIADGRTATPPVTADAQSFKDFLSGMAAIAFTNEADVLDPAETLNTDDRTIPSTRSRLDKMVAYAAKALSDGTGRLENLVSENGVMLGHIDEQKQLHEDVKLLLETKLVDAEAVDMFAVSAEVSQLRTQLEASYSLTATLRQLSLINYLR